VTRPVVALLSDFGTRDHYVSAMKGVILGICPDVSLVDISHDIPVHDVLAAGLELAAVYRYFPTGSIFLVVVDPGVGSERRGLAADVGQYRFVGPDNGVFTAVFEKVLPKNVVELTERRYARPTVSRTFEGRDRFAPAAAWLAKGLQLSILGRSVSDYIKLDFPVAEISEHLIVGKVIRIDRFGNLISNIDRQKFEQFTQTGSIQITIGKHMIGRFVETYSDIGDEEVCALFGSTETLEIAASSASGFEILGVGLGASVLISRK
jgi:S-adenosylmethionine hydrolase